MKIKDLPETASLEGTRFIYPTDGQTYYWFSQWDRGVWGKKNMDDKQVFPLFVTDLKEALEWELVDTSSTLTTHQEEGSAANFERYIA